MDERLAPCDMDSVAYDTWELCGLDSACKRDCRKPTPCKIPTMVRKLFEYEKLGTVEELVALQEATTDAWLQLRTATFSTNKGVADLAKFILSILPEAPKEADNADS